MGYLSNGSVIPDNVMTYYNALGQPVSSSSQTNLDRVGGAYGRDLQSSFQARVGQNGLADFASEFATFQALLGELGKLDLNDTCKARLQSIATTALLTQTIPGPGTPDGDWIAKLRSGQVPTDCQKPGAKPAPAPTTDTGFPWWIVAVAGGGLIIYLLAK